MAQEFMLAQEFPNIQSKIICGDSLEVMDRMPEKVFDAVITDPPYGAGYGKVAGDDSIETYLKALPLIYKVLKSNTFFVSFCYTLHVPEVIQEARKVGFQYRWIGFNYYPNMFKQKPQPLGYNRYDLFLVFSKGDAKKKGYIKDVVHITMDKCNWKERGHPHQKPEKCIEKLLKATTNEEDIILDPFFGSGTLGIVAVKMHRRFVGIEISKEYCEVAKKLIEGVTSVQPIHTNY